jgi:hypothetical protein
MPAGAPLLVRSFQLSILDLFYIVSLYAASLAVHGWRGLVIGSLVLLGWWFVLRCSAFRVLPILLVVVVVTLWNCCATSEELYSSSTGHRDRPFVFPLRTSWPHTVLWLALAAAPLPWIVA